jgi:hypothetical protein
LGRFQEAPRGDYIVQEENGRGPMQFPGQMIENFASYQGASARAHVAEAGYADLRARAIRCAVDLAKFFDIATRPHQATNFGPLLE